MKNKTLYFDEFMETSLYDSDFGYYRSDKIIGREGDFTTAVEESPHVAIALAETYLRVADATNNELELQVVEFGGGTLSLARDFLSYLKGKGHYPSYTVAEKVIGKRKMGTIDLDGCLVQRVDLADLSQKVQTNRNTFIVLHEIIDAFPFKRAKVVNNTLLEIAMKLDTTDETWTETEVDCSAELSKWYQEQSKKIEFVDGQYIEVRTRLNETLSKMLGIFESCCMIAIDYGYTSQEMYLRTGGTICCYKQHKLIPSNRLKMGECDITAHVDFSQVSKVITHLGYELDFWFNLGDWLMAITHLSDKKNLDTISTIEQINKTKHLTRLLLPTELGKSFKVLVMSRKINLTPLSFLAEYDRSELLWT